MRWVRWGRGWHSGGRRHRPRLGCRLSALRRPPCGFCKTCSPRRGREPSLARHRRLFPHGQAPGLAPARSDSAVVAALAQAVLIWGREPLWWPSSPSQRLSQPPSPAPLPGGTFAVALRREGDLAVLGRWCGVLGRGLALLLLRGRVGGIAAVVDDLPCTFLALRSQSRGSHVVNRGEGASCFMRSFRLASCGHPL